MHKLALYVYIPSLHSFNPPYLISQPTAGGASRHYSFIHPPAHIPHPNNAHTGGSSRHYSFTHPPISHHSPTRPYLTSKQRTGGSSQAASSCSSASPTSRSPSSAPVCTNTSSKHVYLDNHGAHSVHTHTRPCIYIPTQ